MILLNNIYIYIVLLLLLLASLKRGNDLLSLLLISMLLYVCPESFVIRFELIIYFVIYFIIGIFLSRKIVNFFFLIFFKKSFTHFNIKKLPTQFLIALKEEITWRYLLVYLIYTPVNLLTNNFIFSFFIAEIISFCIFVSLHSLESRESILEFCTFLIVITILSIIMPGFNVALHMIRNLLIVSNYDLGASYEQEKE